MRLLTKTVPLSPRRSERALGTPLMNTSILNPFGSLSCGTGNLSAAIGNGGGLMPRSLVAASEVGWLGVGGGGVGVDCCAAADEAPSAPASVAASQKPFECDKRTVMRSSRDDFAWPSVRQVVGGAQSESGPAAPRMLGRASAH